MLRRTAWLGILLLGSTEVARAQEAPRGIVREGLGPQRWALLIGVNDYAELQNLKYCSRDMQALAEKLIAAGFPREHVFLLHNEAKDAKYQPFKVNIEKHLDLVLSLAAEDDLVLVAFSGHGMHAGGVSYLCPAEARAKAPEATMVSVDGVYERLKKCKAALKVMVVDACRNDPRPEGEKTADPKADAAALTKQFERPPDGVVVLASCAENQVSWEDSDFQHGVFMNFMLKGLAGEADTNKNGKVSLTELYEYAWLNTKTYVARKRGDFQTPQMRGTLNGVFEFERSGPEPLLKNSLGMELVLIPAGEFVMGSPESETDRDTDEGPQHRVRITKPFYLGKHEVTQQEYERVMGTNPSYFSSTGGGKDKVSGLDTRRFPVEYVSWYDAVEFCNKLSESERLAPHYRLANITRESGRITKADVTIAGGAGYRLPTEAEWEYACRAGTSTPFHFGASNNGSEANIDGNKPYGTTTKGPDLGRTTTIGSYRANAFGLHDMHGNVWEWCQDWYDKDYYAGSPTDDPQGAATGSSRVLRGGGWFNSARHCRSALRSRGTPVLRNSYLGFRVARVP